jgi:hypothetical protein
LPNGRIAVRGKIPNTRPVIFLSQIFLAFFDSGRTAGDLNRGFFASRSRLFASRQTLTWRGKPLFFQFRRLSWGVVGTGIAFSD